MTTVDDYLGPSDQGGRKFVLTAVVLLIVMATAAAGVGALWWRVNGLRTEQAQLEARLQEGKQTLQTQEAELQKRQAEVAELEQKRLMLKVQNDAWAALHKQVEAANPKTAAAAEQRADDQARINPRVYMQASNDAEYELAKKLTSRLRDAGFTVPDIERVKVGPRQTQVRYFRPQDADDARRVVELIKPEAPNATAVVIPGYSESARMRPGHLELWF